MAKKKSDKQTDEQINALSFEEALGQLESMVARIESGEIGLEQSLETYEQGMALVKRCRAVLQHTEQRVETLKVQANGSTGDGDSADRGASESPAPGSSDPPPFAGEDVPF